MNDPARKRSLFGIPAMWLVIGLPLMSIVAGVGLVIVAVRSGGADVVRDEVQRTSQIQVTDLSRDEIAAQRNLSALLRADEGVIDIIPVNGDFDRAQPLKLVLQHPTTAAEDLELTLIPSATGWQTNATIDPGHAWNVELSGADWRLHARLPKAQHAVRLAPALSTP